MACSVAGTAWAEDTAPDATAGAPAPASETVLRETHAPRGRRRWAQQHGVQRCNVGRERTRREHEQ